LTLVDISILDHSKGFGGRYGIESEHQDKSASGWDQKEQLAQHESQKGNCLLLLL